MAHYKETIGQGGEIQTGMQTGQSSFLLRSGDIVVVSVDISPTQVAPGGEMEINVEIQETAEFVGPFDPALCDPPGLIELSGLTSILTVDPDWAPSQSRENCIAVYTTTNISTSERFRVIAPELPEGVDSETHSLSVSIQQPGNNVDTTTFGVEVSRGAFQEPINGGNGGGDLFSTVINNPIKSGIVLVGGTVALRSVLEGD